MSEQGSESPTDGPGQVKPQLSSEQVKELFEQQRYNNLQGLAQIKEHVEAYFRKGFDHWSVQLGKVLALQAQELAIFRELEFYIRHEQLTSELMQDILDRLNNFRQEVAAEYKKEQATTTSQPDAGVV